MKLSFFTSPKQLIIIAIIAVLVAIKTFLYVNLIEWYTTFYDLVQTMLMHTRDVSANEYWTTLFSFTYITIPMIILSVSLEYLTSLFGLFYRGQSCAYYKKHWDKIKDIENPHQRVQDDTYKLSKMFQVLGTPLLETLAILIAFVPILIKDNQIVPEVLLFGSWDYGLLAFAFLSAAASSGVSWFAGRGLPGKEYDIQRVEADYRNDLINERDTDWSIVKGVHLDIFKRYLSFNLVRYSLIQLSAIVAFVALAPSLIAATITFGTQVAIAKVFGRIEESFTFFLRSWDAVVQTMSITKRLNELEDRIDE